VAYPEIEMAHLQNMPESNFLDGFSAIELSKTPTRHPWQAALRGHDYSVQAKFNTV